MFKALFVLADRVERRKGFLFFLPVFQLFFLSLLPLNLPTLLLIIVELLCSIYCFLLVGAGLV